MATTDIEDGLISAMGADGAAAVTDECPTEVPTIAEATEVAARCDQKVFAIESYTPFEQVAALPEYGRLEWSTRTSAGRQDSDGDGVWGMIDTTIEPTAGPDGRLEVAAPALPMSFSDGSSAEPLAVIESMEGETLSFDVPFELTEPVVEGDRVTYPGILGDEDIDLVVTVDSDGTGWREVIRVGTAEAAANPALQGLEFPVEVSDGLELGQSGGGFVATDDEGTEVFRSPTPLLWDARVIDPVPVQPTALFGSRVAGDVQAVEQEQPDLIEGPQSRQGLVEVPADLQPEDNGESGASAGVLRLDPDLAAVASDPDTQFPLFLDPGASGSLHEFTGIKSAWPDSSSGYKFADEPNKDHGTGLCDYYNPYGFPCERTSKHRVLYEFNNLGKVAGLDASEIKSAEFNVFGSWAFDCQARKTALYLIGSNEISSSTSWSSGGSWTNAIAIRDTAHKWHECGSQQPIGFSSTAAAKKVASSNWTSLTLGLKVNEDSMTDWKRYAGNQWAGNADFGASFSVVYDQLPLAPTGTKTFTSSDYPEWWCADGLAFSAWLRPQISGVLRDPDGQSVQGHFQVKRVSTGSVSVHWTSLKSSGSRHTIRPGSNLVANERYTWRMRAVRDGVGGPWSSWCPMMIDNEAPGPPKITAEPMSTSGVEAVYLERDPDGPKEHGGIGMRGKFRISTGAWDAERMLFGFADPSLPHRWTLDSSGQIVVSFVPSREGPVTIYAKVRDKSGNESTAATYTFDVAAPRETAVWRLDDGSGTSASEALGLVGSQPLEFRGTESTSALPRWVDGPHELFGSRDGDHAVAFDGVDDRLFTTAGVVSTNSSFVVSAHVWVDPGATRDLHAALSQDGSTTSAFQLGTFPCSQHATGVGCFNFHVAGTDSGTATVYRVMSTTPVVTGQWVHLTGAFDAKTKKVSLWVCEIGTPQDPKPADPQRYDRAEADAVSFATTRPFVVGRSLVRDVQDKFWQGRIDNVRVFDGQLVAENKVRRLCQGADAKDFTRGAAAIDPTIKDTVESSDW
ncbi:LamG domain-containing protein [Promicromonospora sp. NPDC050880]|uniref:LamG domain-containing protein n=1 Tax=Promicromonospora sp. NPDC050880 TaxID=3364406 RepID=UPI0037BA5E43